jgi:hypothetical protein
MTLDERITEFLARLRAEKERSAAENTWGHVHIDADLMSDLIVDRANLFQQFQRCALEVSQLRLENTKLKVAMRKIWDLSYDPKIMTTEGALYATGVEAFWEAMRLAKEEIER